MPPNVVSDPSWRSREVPADIQRAADRPLARLTVRMTEGQTLDGQVVGEGFDDLQLRTDDKQVHLLRRAGDRFRAVTSETPWPTYNGDPGGNRYTTLTQIDKHRRAAGAEVDAVDSRRGLAAGHAGRRRGIMYVTAE